MGTSCERCRDAVRTLCTRYRRDLQKANVLKIDLQISFDYSNRCWSDKISCTTLQFTIDKEHNWIVFRMDAGSVSNKKTFWGNTILFVWCVIVTPGIEIEMI